MTRREEMYELLKSRPRRLFTLDGIAEELGIPRSRVQILWRKIGGMPGVHAQWEGGRSQVVFFADPVVDKEFLEEREKARVMFQYRNFGISLPPGERAAVLARQYPGLTLADVGDRRI